MAIPGSPIPGSLTVPSMAMQQPRPAPPRANDPLHQATTAVLAVHQQLHALPDQTRAGLNALQNLAVQLDVLVQAMEHAIAHVSEGPLLGHLQSRREWAARQAEVAHAAYVVLTWLADPEDALKQLAWRKPDLAASLAHIQAGVLAETEADLMRELAVRALVPKPDR